MLLYNGIQYCPKELASLYINMHTHTHAHTHTHTHTHTHIYADTLGQPLFFFFFFLVCMNKRFRKLLECSAENIANKQLTPKQRKNSENCEDSNNKR